MIIERAGPADLDELTTLAIRSKAHWGYDETFMASSVGELTVPAKALEAEIILMARCHENIAGFIRLVPGEEAEIEAMFVAPEAIGKGIGRRLFDEALALCDPSPVTVIAVSDPNAEGFYLKLGFRPVDRVPSGSIEGRTLPRLRLERTKRRGNPPCISRNTI